MMEEPPLVSVLVPLRNSTRTLAYALASIAAQDYPNVEIIVSDNCSSDDTASLARAFVAQDPRRRFIQQKTPLPVFEHFSRIIPTAAGKYIVFCADDDSRADNYLSALVETLEATPRAILAYGKTFVFASDPKTAIEKPHRFDTMDRGRLGRVCLGAGNRCYHFYGLWRGDVLRALPLITCLHWPDMPIMLSAAAIGPFIKTDATSFLYREIPKTSSTRLQEQSMISGASLLRQEWSLISAVTRALYPLGGLTSVIFALAVLCQAEFRYILYPLTPPLARRLWARFVRGRTA